MDMVKISPNDFNSLILSSFRYSLGRKSYITFETSQMIIKYIDHISEFIIQRMIKEIEVAINTKNYGMEIDKEIWSELLNKLKEQIIKINKE